jgi:hypothetical protein
MQIEVERPAPPGTNRPDPRDSIGPTATATPVIRNVADLRSRGLDRAIVEAGFPQETARVLLIRSGVPDSQIPAYNDADVFWEEVFRRIGLGVIPADSPADGFAALLAQFAVNWPGSPAFRPWHPDHRTTSVEPNTPSQARELPPQGTGIVLPDYRDQPDSFESNPPSQTRELTPQGTGIVLRDYRGQPDDVFRRVEETARHLGIPMPVELALANDVQISLFLPNANPTDASRLAVALQGLQQGLEVQPTRPGLRDYYFQRLYGEGPDGGRFEYTNVPASTTIGELAAATINQYGDEGWARDQDGLPRPAVVDLVRGQGSQRQEERMNPDLDLDAAGVREGDTFQPSPEATAAAGVNPNVREQALARARAQIQRFAQEHTALGVRLFANTTVAPTQYVLAFTAPGWAPPPKPGDAPERIDQHMISIDLPPDFPMKAPLVMWKSPIFHPNIHPRNGVVCLGDLMDGYIPGMDLARLCQLVVDIATYRNYEVRSVFNAEARDWATTEAGAALIKANGGTGIDEIVKHIATMSVTARRPGFRIRRTPGVAEAPSKE